MKTGDYYDLILSGYFDNPKYLQNHIVRECKRAIVKGVNVHEFFERCLDVTLSLTNEIEKQFNSWKEDKEAQRRIAEKGNLTEAIAEINETLNKNNINTFTLNILSYNIQMTDINFINAKLEKAVDEIAILLKTLPSQQIETKTELETETFTNNFDKNEPTEIYKHFKAGLVEKGYLTEQELNEYLKAAFEMKAIPGTLFKIKDAPTKQKVMKVFYEYYKNIAGKPYKKQSQYAALLGDYFEGFNTQNVSTNFNK